MQIGCVVMASGNSARFGENKLLVPFWGKPLICHTLERMPKSLDAVLVVTRSQEVSGLAQAMGFACQLHALPDVSSTIRLGISAMLAMDGCMFCVSDQPLMTKQTMERLVDAFVASPDAIVRACFGERDGNPVLFPRALFAELSQLLPGQTGSTVIGRHADMVIRVAAGAAIELMDVDTRESLIALENAQNR